MTTTRTHTSKKPHDVIRTMDDRTGHTIVHVLLSRSADRVAMREDDYLRFIEEHGERPLFLNRAGHGRGYVRFRHAGRGNLAMLARFVAGEPARKRIVYNDGNPRNLRRDNLTPTTGRFAGTRKRPSRKPSEPTMSSRCGTAEMVA